MRSVKRSKQRMRRIYTFLVLLIALFFFVRSYVLPRIPPTGEFGEVEGLNLGQAPDSGSSNSDKSLVEEILGIENNAPDTDGFNFKDIPEYSGTPVYIINDNKPSFTDAEYEKAKSKYIELSELDALGRCGKCEASLGQDTLAQGERDFDLSHVTPSGWNQAQYEDLIDNGGWIWNRCHLISWCVSGLRDNERNLITGTRYLNTKAMLNYSELAIQNYLIKKAGADGRILYRVTPVYGSNLELVPRGVRMEAADVATRGEAFHINLYAYNVQPGIEINYYDGSTRRAEN